MIPLYLAAALFLTWDFPRDLTPPVEAFLLSAITAEGVDQWRVAPSTPASCTQAPEATDDTYCTLWPGCPAEGLVTLSVQAVRDTETSEAKTFLACHFWRGQPCVCHTSPEQAPAPPPRPATPTPSTPAPQPAPDAPTFPVIAKQGST